MFQVIFIDPFTARESVQADGELFASRAAAEAWIRRNTGEYRALYGVRDLDADLDDMMDFGDE